MQQETTLSRWCERVIEAGWLVALTLIPIYFNLLSARHFEPDKATTLRAIVLLMAGVALIRALERLNTRPESRASNVSARGTTATNPFEALWKRLNNIPLAIPALLYALVFIVTTFTSVVPHTSFWGSYQRLQGTYTNLSYIILFFIIVATLRRREQLERLVTVVILTGVTVAGYGILQHLQLDPLPWRGDVITRVASTMGNAIFVAAYLIMVVPLALYRLIISANETRNAPSSNNPVADISWAIAYAVLVFGTLSLLLAVIKFGAVVRTSDFRYWWVFPGAILISTSLWVLLTYRPQDDRQLAVPLWPGVVYMVYMLFFGATFSFSANAQAQVFDERIVNGLDWWLWALASVAAIIIFYVLSFVLPRQSAVVSRLSYGLQTAGNLVVTLMILAAIFFSQSRGPWIGLGAGLFVFFVFLLWQAMRHAQIQERMVTARRLRIALGAWVALTLAVGGFLIVFNVSNAPFFNQLRTMPYIGRMGQLLETRYGTGRVRTLIWMGDEHAGGAVALITADPLRTLIGWGPESMFVAYNPFYPPALATLESRGASPDRSHQAILDQLVTKGVLGLVSYLFVLISFLALCWRLIRSSNEWRWQVFFIACLSIITTHFVEGLTGIPIVSTLTMFWVAMGVTVSGGAMAGLYTIGAASKAAAEPTTEDDAAANTEDTPDVPPDEAATPASKPASRSRRRKGRVSTAPTRGRGQPARAGNARRGGTAQTNPAAMALYAVLLTIVLAAVWWFNLSTIYADMRFHEGQAFSEQQVEDINQQLSTTIVAMSKFIDTINSNPREDFYYLNLGRTLMNLADLKRRQGTPLGQEHPDVEVDTLLDLHNVTEVGQFVQNPQTTPLMLMSYAQATLQEARSLNPMNKDHYANLARLNNFWFNWTQNPEKLRTATQWYSQANEVAPQDVTLLNEHANVLLVLATYTEAQQNTEAAQQYQVEAAQLLERSRFLDPEYSDTITRLAELYRTEGYLVEAADLYVDAIQRKPEQVNPLIEDILATYAGNRDILLRLRDAYMASAESNDDALQYAIAGLISLRVDDQQSAVTAYQQATSLEPNNLEHRLNYAIVLSDTQQFDQALAEAQTALEQAQNQGSQDNQIAQLQYLVNLLQPKAAGGS